MQSSLVPSGSITYKFVSDVGEGNFDHVCRTDSDLACRTCRGEKCLVLDVVV